MNPAGILAIILAVVVGYFGFSGLDLPSFRFGPGPLATGPGRGAEIENPQPVGRGGFFGIGGDRQEKEPPKPGESPYKGTVRIATVSRSEDQPEDEYVVIRYGGGFFGGGDSAVPAVDVTGWRIGSAKTFDTIPRAFNITEIDASEQNIFLPSGGELIVTSGTPSYTRNFRENQCTGYFNEHHSFTPSLSNSCRDDNPDRGALISRGFNGECIEAIGDVPSCRAAQGPFLASIIKAECLDYLNQNFSYAGCVKNFRGEKDFLKNTWRVSLRRNQKLFDPKHDRVILRDAQGLLVDEFEY